MKSVTVFGTALKQLRKLCADMTTEQLKLTKMENFSFDAYAKELNTCSSNEEAEASIFNMIKMIHETIADHDKTQGAIDRAKYRDAVKDLKDFVTTLTHQEKKNANIDLFYFERVESRFKEEEENIRHIINSAKNRKKDQDWISIGITIPNLLVRYEKLPACWRAFVKRRIGSMEDDDIYVHFASVENDNEHECEETRWHARVAIERFASIIYDIEDALREK